MWRARLRLPRLNAIAPGSIGDKAHIAILLTQIGPEYILVVDAGRSAKLGKTVLRMWRARLRRYRSSSSFQRSRDVSSVRQRAIEARLKVEVQAFERHLNGRAAKPRPTTRSSGRNARRSFREAGQNSSQNVASSITPVPFFKFIPVKVEVQAFERHLNGRAAKPRPTTRSSGTCPPTSAPVEVGLHQGVDVRRNGFGVLE
jgi:hypothetical protein